MLKTDIKYIYLLVDPLDNDVCYVGSTKEPKTRFSDHVYLARKGKTKCAAWFRDLSELGRQPAMRIIETCPECYGIYREAYWMDYYSNLGCNLVNQHRMRGRAMITKYIADMLGHELFCQEVMIDQIERVVTYRPWSKTMPVKQSSVDRCVAILEAQSVVAE